jgi:uncharacterized protein (TIGR02588 family)
VNRRDHPKPAASPRSPRARHRRLAEWVSLGVSVLLIAALAGYLIFEGFRSRSPFVPVEVRIELDQAQRSAGRFILPVTVRNLGNHTLRDVRVVIEHGSPADPEKRGQDFDIDYLGERSEQRLFLYLDEDPKSLSIGARAAQYRLD